MPGGGGGPLAGAGSRAVRVRRGLTVRVLGGVAQVVPVVFGRGLGGSGSPRPLSPAGQFVIVYSTLDGDYYSGGGRADADAGVQGSMEVDQNKFLGFAIRA